MRNKLNNNTWFLSILSIIFGLGFIQCKKTFNDPDNIINLSLSENLHRQTYDAPVQISFANLVDKSDYTAQLNNTEIFLDEPLFVNDAGFYELLITNNTTQKTDTNLFVILAKSRGKSEWGLPEFTPTSVKTDNITTEKVKLIYPKNRYSGIPLPVCIKLSDTDETYLNKNYQVSTPTISDIELIRRGIGSVNLNIADNLSIFDLGIGSQNFSQTINLPGNDTVQIPLLITNRYEIPANKTVILESDLKILESGQLTINEGCLLLVNEGINIYNSGIINANGNEQNPVYITCRAPGKYWGGFINENNSHVNIQHCFLTASGYHTSEEYQWGHAKQQALFYGNNSVLNIKNSYMIDNSGQIFYTEKCELNIANCLIQRSKTGGQQNHTQLTIDSSVFMDIPYKDHTFIDNDNDGIYLVAGNTSITNSSFMYTKDDGIDSGASSGGNVLIENCHFEGIFHEGLALSSGNSVTKTHLIKSSTFTNCGQGVELGYSSENHTVLVDNCTFYNNVVGIRYGDNYDWEYKGKMQVTNSSSYNNIYKDVWNMVHTDWTGYYENLSFSNTSVSIYNPNYPDLILLK